MRNMMLWNLYALWDGSIIWNSSYTCFFVIRTLEKAPISSVLRNIIHCWWQQSPYYTLFIWTPIEPWLLCSIVALTRAPSIPPEHCSALLRSKHGHNSEADNATLLSLYNLSRVWSMETLSLLDPWSWRSPFLPRLVIALSEDLPCQVLIDEQ